MIELTDKEVSQLKMYLDRVRAECSRPAFRRRLIINAVQKASLVVKKALRRNNKARIKNI